MARTYRIQNLEVWTSEGTTGNNSSPMIVAPHKTMGKDAFRALKGTGAKIYDPCEGCPDTNGGCSSCSFYW